MTTINRDELTQLSAALQAAQKEIERLTGEQWAFEDAVSQAIGSPRFMDPPDGGDVSLPEQVDRMHQALEAAEARVKELEFSRKKWEQLCNQWQDKYREVIRERDELRRALRDKFCPRPCNGRPDDFDVGDCVDAGECGCSARAALNQEGS